MKTLSAAFCLLLLLSCGCGDSPDSLVTEQIAIMDETAASFENGGSRADSDKLQARKESLNKRIKALNLSAKEMQELNDRHEDALKAAELRLTNAMIKNANSKKSIKE